MASAKDVTMNLLIKAKVSGVGAFSKIDNLMTKLANKAGLTNLSFGKLAKGAALIGLGFEGIKSAMEFMKGAVEEAEQAINAEERLGAALKHRKDLQQEANKQGVALEGQVEALSKVADDLEKVGVIGGTELMKGFRPLIEAGFSPDSIGKMALGFEGLNVHLHGIGASGEQVTKTANQLKSLIKMGGKFKIPKEWREKGIITEKEIAQLKKGMSGMEKAALVRKMLVREEHRVAEAAGTTAGKVWKAEQSWRKLQETFGKPIIKSRTAFKQMLGEIADALQPVTEELADMMTPAMTDFANWIKSMTPAIRDFGHAMLDFVRDVGDYFKGKEFSGAIEGVSKSFKELAETVGLGDLFKENKKAATEFLNPATGSYEHLNRESEAASQFTAAITRELGELKRAIDIVIKAINDLKEAWDFFTKGKLPEVNQVEKDAALANKELKDFIRTGKEADKTKLPSEVLSEAAKAKKESREEMKAQLSGRAKYKRLTYGPDKHIELAGIPGQASLLGAAGTPLASGDIYRPIAKMAPAIDDASKSTEKLQTSFTFTTESAQLVGTEVGTLKGTLDSLNVSNLNSSLDLAKGKVGELGTAISTLPSAPSVPTMPTGQLGGLMTRPTIIGEAGPEMAIPMKDNARSRDLLMQAAEALGMGGNGKSMASAARSKTMLDSILGAMGINLDTINIGGVNLGKALGKLEPGPVGGAHNLSKMQEEIFSRMQNRERPINLSMHSPITINGVSGDAGSIAKEVETALANQTANIKTLLEQMKRARDEEHRTAYV